MAIYSTSGAKIAISRLPDDTSSTLAQFRPTLTADTIAFVAGTPATITDSGNGFAGKFVAGDKVVVTGSTSNNGTYTIATVAAGTLTLAAGQTLTAEAAGDDVTLEADRFVTIGENSEITGLQETANEVTFTSLGDARERLLKGTARAARPSMTMGLDFTDPGQQILAVAGAPNNQDKYLFRITLNDKPVGGVKPTTIYGRGSVFNYAIQGLTADNVVQVSAMFGSEIGLVYDKAA